MTKPNKDTFFLPNFSSMIPTTGDNKRHPTSVKLKCLCKNIYAIMIATYYSSNSDWYFLAIYVGSTASAQSRRLLIANNENKVAIMILLLSAFFSGLKFFSTSSISSFCCFSICYFNSRMSLVLIFPIEYDDPFF